MHKERLECVKSLGVKIMACRHTQLAVHANWGDSFRLGQCQRVGRILVVPRAGRRGGLGLAMTEIDSGLARELECVEI